MLEAVAGLLAVDEAMIMVAAGSATGLAVRFAVRFAVKSKVTLY